MTRETYFYVTLKSTCQNRSDKNPKIQETLIKPSSCNFFNNFHQQNLDIYIYKNSIKTSDIGLTAYVGGDSPTKFEIWFRKRKPGDTWTLQSMNEDIKHTWSDEISTLLWKQAKRNRGNERLLLRESFQHISLFLTTNRSSNGGNVINGNRQ